MPLDIDTLRQLEEFLGPRFDTIDATFKELRKDISTRDHARRGSVETMAVQMTELIAQMSYMRQATERMERWREEGGPLDGRFSRMEDKFAEALTVMDARYAASESEATARHVAHEARTTKIEGWQNRTIGAMMLLATAFPTTVGVILFVLGKR